MAKVVKVEYICDVCQNPRRKVKPYRIAQDGDSVRVMLCKEHGKPLEDLLKLGERVPSTSGRVRVYDFEEIEKMKAQQKRKK